MENIADEFRNILEDTYDYKGMPCSKLIPQSSVEALIDWETREDDIFIATYPKSGTHWMWETVLLIHQDGFSEKIDRQKMLPTTLEMLLLPDMKVPTHEIWQQRESPRVMITHLPWHLLPKQVTEEKKGKIVSVIRNPKDVLTSLSRFYVMKQNNEKNDKLWKFIMQSFMDGTGFGGSWFDYVQGYLDHEEEDNVFITTYEKMKLNFEPVIKDLSTFLGCPLDEHGIKRAAENASLPAMKNSYDKIEKDRSDGKMVTRAFGRSPFIQKGVLGSWKEFFTVSENEMFDAVYQERTKGMKLNLIFEAN